MPSRSDVGVVIPAAGRGIRTGGPVPKQYREVAGVPLLLRSLRPFASHPDVRQIVVALPPEDVDSPPRWLESLLSKRLTVVSGGETRAVSVRNGLAELPDECSVVLVHDAARPFVTRDVIDRVIERARGGTSCLAAVRMSDTVKKANGDVVLETVDRSHLWRAQTPQGFPRKVLEDAYAAFGDTVEATDESALVEASGARVELVEDDPGNIKLTLPRDFEIAEALLK